MNDVSMIILPPDEISPTREELCARLRIPPSGEFPVEVAEALCDIRRHAECKAAFVGCEFELVGNNAEISGAADTDIGSGEAANADADTGEGTVADTDTDEGTVLFPFGEVKSRSLAKILAPCRSAVLFAATLGMGVERYLCALEAAGPSRTFFADAVASAFIEALCDRAGEMISERFGRVTGRFSPGYGDLPLSIQPSLLSSLNAGRVLGITLTDSMLMIPRKTVSAIIGVKND